MRRVVLLRGVEGGDPPGASSLYLSLSAYLELERVVKGIGGPVEGEEGISAGCWCAVDDVVGVAAEADDGVDRERGWWLLPAMAIRSNRNAW